MDQAQYRITTHSVQTNRGSAEKSRHFTDYRMTRAEAEDWIRSLNPEQWRIWDCDERYLAVATPGLVRVNGSDAPAQITAALYAEIGDEVREFLHWHLEGVSEYFAGQ